MTENAHYGYVAAMFYPEAVRLSVRLLSRR